MEPILLPLPDSPERARLLLEYIRYGIILVKTVGCGDHTDFFVKSPEKINIGGKEYNPRKILIEFKRKLQVIDKEFNIVLKRAPYKNEFDNWGDNESKSAFDEFKMWLMIKFSEEELMI